MLCTVLVQIHGQVQRSVGSRGCGDGQLDDAIGLALSTDEAFLIVVDTGNRRLVVLCAEDGAFVRHLTGPPGTLSRPLQVAVVPSTGQVVVTDVGTGLTLGNPHHTAVCFASIDD